MKDFSFQNALGGHQDVAVWKTSWNKNLEEEEEQPGGQQTVTSSLRSK